MKYYKNTNQIFEIVSKHAGITASLVSGPIFWRPYDLEKQNFIDMIGKDKDEEGRIVSGVCYIT